MTSPSFSPPSSPDLEIDALLKQARCAADAAYAQIVSTAPWLASSDQWMVRVLRITQEAASLKSRYRKLVQWADETADHVAPHAQCRKTCAHCCHIAVGLTEQEAAFIGEAIAKTPRRPARAHRLSDEGITPHEDVAYYQGVPCPFLDGQVCSIYAHRPLACRLHFNIGDARLCAPDIPSDIQGVPNLDFFPLFLAMTTMCLEKKPDTAIADIREFF